MIRTRFKYQYWLLQLLMAKACDQSCAYLYISFMDEVLEPSCGSDEVDELCLFCARVPGVCLQERGSEHRVTPSGPL